MRIDVTGVDIFKGKPHSPEACPVALAINRQLEGTGMIALADSGVVDFVRHGVIVRSVSLPRRMAEWINRYNRKGRAGVKAIRFQIELPAGAEWTIRPKTPKVSVRDGILTSP